MRIVLGINVFIAALLGRESGSAWKTVEADLKGADRILAAFIQCCRWTKIYFRWRPNLRDEGDNHIMELAVTGLANWIIINNIKDLKSGELFFKGLEVATPEQ